MGREIRRREVCYLDGIMERYFKLIGRKEEHRGAPERENLMIIV